ncbi:competence type IV pilus minor pilin ComGG [Bacillus kexueae]|uniref:competence type IV pilus minor pilin ComGG n=1 Tax=Aeribacillus kexueae TaxID=2078952 RepID=UPI001FAEB382|nr:competence type IV pilus minor pilin ComGG [Bacillus kexueae]
MNEKGYVYPFALFMTLIFLLIAMVNANIHIRNERFFEDSKEYYRLRLLTLNAVQCSQKNLENVSYKSFQTPNGSVMYEINQKNEGLLDVNINIETRNGTFRSFSYQYDVKSKQIVGWTDYEN